MSNRRFSARQWDRTHFSRTEEYAHQVEMIYRAVVDEAARLGSSLAIDRNAGPPNKPFSFAAYPAVAARVKTLLNHVYDQLQTTILAGHQAEWDLANQKNDALVRHVLGLGTTELPAEVLNRFMGRNLEALAAFQTRKVNGLNLSQRVTTYTGQFKKELELGLDLGIGQGKSAAQLSRDLRSYLNDPDKLFRRVKNKHGQLGLSKAAKAYHPGQGVYRSSYKNMMRLTRTEINSAYREADHARWQSLDFVVGIEVRRSNNTSYGCDVCESLKGKYPKDFKFVGWHPQCRCVAISILASPDELRKINQLILAGQDTAGFVSNEAVRSVPANFSDWVTDNRDQLVKVPALPGFIRDNKGFVNLSKATPVDPPKPTAEQILLADTTFQKVMADMKSRSGLPAKLTLIENATINNYTRSIYYDLNRHMRGASKVPNTELLEAMSETLSGALNKLPGVKKPVYRIVDFSSTDIQEFKDAIAKKQPVAFRAFTSTSLNPNLAFEGNVQMIIRSKRGRNITEVSHFKGEQEVLFDKNTVFRVEEVTFDGSRTVIRLTEI